MGVCRRGRQNYLRASLWESGKRWKPSVHQIVALAFIGACPTGGTVNHKDGNKLNNHYSNLEYVTRSQNQLHAYAIGLQVSQKGEARPLAKLTPEDVHYILRREKTAKALAVEFGVSESLIYMLLSGRRWKHIPRESL